MDDICAICGDNITCRLSHKLNCGPKDQPHEFHYECLMKNSFNTPDKGIKCPYCRINIGFLPLVNGLKKITPGIHCSPYFHDIQEKKKELIKYQVKCNHILTRGKRKNQLCGKNCKLGSNYCGLHIKNKFDSQQNCIIIKKQEEQINETEK